MNIPSNLVFYALLQSIEWLFRRPFELLMYLIIPMKSKNQLINNPDQIRDMMDQQSALSILHLLNGSTVNWKCKKQLETSRSTSNI